MDELERKKKEAIWVAKSLFDRGKTAGSSANLSFRHGNEIYISGSGTCFGTLKESDFSVVDMDGRHIAGIKPSKELPLHQQLYKSDDTIQAVLHTHSFYSVLWSCLEHENEKDVVPGHTPYLKMKVGTIGLVPYAPPGSEELFKAFGGCIGKSDGYLLKNHGPVITGGSMMEAFYGLEELEESVKVAWHLRN